jgi:hypothetical protein
MSEFDFDLSDVADMEDVQLADASEYQDQTGPTPLAPGNYRFRVDEGGIRRNNDGEPILDNGYNQVQLNKLTIVEPEEFKDRVVFPFKSFTLRPVQGGQRKGTVPAVDLLRGFDDTAIFSNGKEVISLLGEQFQNGGTFVAGSNWIAKDS